MDLIFYNGDHSAKFGEKHTWDDWHLIPSGATDIAPPTIKQKTVDIPGANGMLDLSAVLTGFPTYNDRTGSISYILAPGGWSWETAKTEIMGYLHGQRMNLYLDDDPGYFWNGLFWVNDLKSDKNIHGITINYDLYPYKRELVASDDGWLWDPFNFETGVIREWNTLTVDGTLDLTVSDCAEPVMPTIVASAAMTMTHSYVAYDHSAHVRSYQINSGTSIPGFTLRPGNNQLHFVGNGTVTVRFRGGKF